MVLQQNDPAISKYAISSSELQCP